MNARLPALLALAMIALAGCAEQASGPRNQAPIVDEEEYDGFEATSATGVIRGLVIDEAIRPLSGASIHLTTPEGDRNTTSADSGAFGFADLFPGTYFLTAAKVGFKTIQVSADVVAGESQPPITKMLMVADPASTPYFSVTNWSGYIECSLRVGVPTTTTSVGVNACNGVANQDVNFPLGPFDQEPDFVQGEMVWDSTQSFGSGLSFVVGPPNCRDVKYARADGESPLVIALNNSVLLDKSAAAEDDGFDPEKGICYRAFSFVAAESQGALGLVTSQRFETFFHAFYNMVPPEGWQFSVDGDPPLP